MVEWTAQAKCNKVPTIFWNAVDSDGVEGFQGVFGNRRLRRLLIYCSTRVVHVVDV
jgi:hypothetical protein